MSLSDPISDMLTRIRNGQSSMKTSVRCPASNFKIKVLDVLRDEGYIRGYTTEDIRPGLKDIIIELKYHEGKPVIQELSRLSKPGCRSYTPASKLPRIYNGLGMAILSTSKGVVSDFEARSQGVGGELICKVF